MRVSVVIPTWRRPQLLKRCLDGVLAQDPKPDEVMVVARREDHEALRVIDQIAVAEPVRWVEVQQPGHVPPIRAALEAVNTEAMAIIDDDAVPESGWLAALMDVISDPTVAVAGGFVRTPGSEAVPRRGAGRISWYGQHIGNVAAIEASEPLAVDGVMEGNSIWRTELMRQLQFPKIFDGPGGSMYGLDLCLQAKELGYSVMYTSRARVLHTPGPRWPDVNDRRDRSLIFRSYSRNYTYIALRHLPSWRGAIFTLWWWLVGERGSYGVATTIFDSLGRGIPGGPAVIAASFAGKADGVRAWLNDR